MRMNPNPNQRTPNGKRGKKQKGSLKIQLTWKLK